MKKTLSIVAMAVLLTSSISAQESKCQFTVNTRAWTTNYWTNILYNIAQGAIVHWALDGNTIAEAIIPDADLVFPIGIAKEGFVNSYDIYGPYHRAFSNPFKQLGDYGIGLDASCMTTNVGMYAGIYYKSQELCFKTGDENLRGNYLQPRAGLIFGKDRKAFEVGVFYDEPLSCTGSFQYWGNPNKEMIQGGLGLDFAFSLTNRDGNQKNLLTFSMPLHNFLNDNYAGGMTKGLNRRVAYLMFTHRIVF